MASSTVAALTASDALTGASLFYADGLASAVAADVKVTATQIKTWTSASPTLVTPVLGVATGTSIALTGTVAVGGTTIFSAPSSDSTTGGSIAIGVGALTGQTVSAAYGSTAIGYQALNGTMTTAAVNNTAIGYQALQSNISGNDNSAVGYQALAALTTGDANSAFGWQSQQFANSSGNVSLGFRAMWQDTSGGNNTAVGSYASYLNQTGGANVAVGTQALLNNTSSDNTAVGNEAGAFNTTGATHVYMGHLAGRDNLTSNNNVALGQQAQRYGLGGNNVSVGKDAFLGVSTVTTGTDHVILGYNAGSALTTGSQNVLIGSGAGNTLTTGSNNIVLGFGQQAPAAGTSNSLNIGGLITGDLSAKTTVLNGQVTNTGGTITTSKPFTITQTWNAAGVTFTTFLVNSTSTASGVSSLLADFQTGGASQFSVRKDGAITANLSVSTTAGTEAIRSNLGLKLASTHGLAWQSTGTAFGTDDTTLSRNAAGVVQFGTNAINAAGSWLATNGTLTGTLDTTGPIRGSHGYTVATLPAAGTAGRMAYVTDALTPAFLATVVGGGAVITPVFDNGTNWVGA